MAIIPAGIGALGKAKLEYYTHRSPYESGLGWPSIESILRGTPSSAATKEKTHDEEVSSIDITSLIPTFVALNLLSLPFNLRLRSPL